MSMVHFGGSYGAAFPGTGIVEKAEVWRAAAGELVLIAAAAAQKTKRWRLFSTSDNLDAMLLGLAAQPPVGSSPSSGSVKVGKQASKLQQNQVGKV